MSSEKSEDLGVDQEGSKASSRATAWWRFGTDDPTSGFSDDEVSRYALDIVYGKIPGTNDSYFGGTIAQCDRADAKIKALRDEYADYTPKRVRRAIMDWMDFYQQRADEDRRDLESGKHKREMQEHGRKSDEKTRRISELAARLRAESVK